MYRDGDLIVFKAGNDSFEMTVAGDQDAGQGHVRVRDHEASERYAGKSFLVIEEHIVLHQPQLEAGQEQ